MTGLLGREPTSTLDLTAVEAALIGLDVGTDLPSAIGNLGFAPSPEPARATGSTCRT